MRSARLLDPLDHLDRQPNECLSSRTLRQSLDEFPRRCRKLPCQLNGSLYAVALAYYVSSHLDIAGLGEFTQDQGTEFGVILPCE